MGIVDGPADLVTPAGGAGSGAANNAGSGTGGSTEPYARCIPCHGPTGEGTAFGYELRHPVRSYASWVVRHGRPGTEFGGSAMAAYGTDSLSDADLVDIFDYLDGFPQPTDGQGLYLDYCRNCHGANARGGVTGIDISDKAYRDLLEKVREGEGAGGYDQRAQYMPAFGAAVLSDAEVKAIAEYLTTL